MKISDLSMFLRVLRKDYSATYILDMLDKVLSTIIIEESSGKLVDKGIEWSDSELSLYEIFKF